MQNVGIRIGAEDATKPAFDSVNRGLGGLQNAARTAQSSLAALGIGVSVGAFVAFAQNIVKGIDALNDLKDATGASIENISALEDVALRTGSSFATVETSLIKFNKALSDAKPGSDAELALKALGLRVKDLKDLDPAEALLKTAVALQGFADDANKARLVQELFGKSLKEMAPLLKDLAEKGRLVATVTTEQAEAAEKFNKEISNLNKNVLDLSRTLVGSMAESINKTIQLFRDGAKEGKSFFAVLREEQMRLLGLNDGQKEYAQRIADITEKLKDNNIHATRRAALLREQAALQAKVIPTLDSSYDTLESARLARARPSLPSIDSAGAKAAAAAAAKALADQNKELADQAKLLAELAGLTGSFAEDWARLTTIYKSNKLSLEGLTKAQAELLAKQPAIKNAKDAEAKALETVTKAYEAAEKAHADYSKGIADGLGKLTADTRAQEDYNARLGLTKEAIAALDAANLELQATKLDGLAIDRLVQYQDEINYQSLKDQAAELRRLAVLKQTGAAKETALEAAKEAESAWKKTADSIESSLTDALMRGFESGKEFGRNLRDTLVNMFKTLVLRPIISAVMNPIAQGITGMLGVSGTASAAGSALQAGGSLAAIGSSVSSFLAPATAAMSTFGTAALASTQSLIGLTGTAAQASTAVANGLAMGATGSGSMMASIGSAMPYVAAAVAVAAAVGLFRSTKTVGQGISGTFGEDTTLESYTAKRKSGYLFGGPKYWDEKSPLDATTTRNLGNAFLAVKESAASAATALGLSADSVTSYSKTFRLALTGDAAKDQAATEALFAGMSEDMARGILGSYKDVVTTVREEIAANYTDWGDGAPGGFTERQVTTSTYTASEFAKEGETAAQTLQRLAVSIGAVNSTFDTLGHDLITVGLQGASTASKLIDAFGGLENFAATTASYYQNFYSDAERTARLTEVTSAAFASLGLVMPTLDEGARAAYRSLVETAAAQDMSVEANRNAYAGLLALNGAMNQLAPAFVETAQAARDAATAAEAAAQQTRDAAKAMVGFDAAGLGQMMLDAAFNPQAGMSAAESFGAALQASVQNALISSTVGSIAESIYNSIIMPIIAGAAVSKAATDAVMADAAAKMNALAGVLKSDAFKDGIASIIGTVSGMLPQVATFAPQVYAPPAAYEAPANTALQDAAARDADALKTATDALSLNAQIAELTGDKQLAAAVKTHQHAVALHELNKQDPTGNLAALTSQLWELQDAAAVAAAATKQEAEIRKTAMDALGINAQIAELTGNKALAEAVRGHQRAVALDELNKQDPSGNLTELTRQLWALQDAAKVTAEAVKLASTNQGWQDQLDVLAGARTSTEVDRANALAAATDDSTRAIMQQVYAQQDAKAATEAAAAAVEAMAQRMTGALASLADNRIGLQAQLLTAQGDPAGALALARKAELDKLTEGLSATDAASIATAYAYNTALEDQIKTVNEAAQAARDAADAQARAAADAASASKQLTDAWQSVTDSIFDEVARIRGLLGGDSAASMAQAQARFTITSAQARAGDRDAAKLLPQLSQTLLTLAEANAASLVELRRIQGQTAASLSLTGNTLTSRYGLALPSFAVGTDYVPYDMTARIHEGEAIVPRAYNPAAGGVGSAEMVAELRAVRKELVTLRRQVDETNAQGRRTADAVNGRPENTMQVEVVT